MTTSARRTWVPLLAVTLIAAGGIIGTAVVSPSEATESGEMLGRFVVASSGAILMVVCWRPDLEQIRSFGLLWVAGGVVSALVALFAGVPRPAGLAPHSTHLAIISLILLGVSLGLISSERRWRHLIPGLIASGVLLAAIVVSGSRAALAAAAVVILLMLIATRNRVAVATAIAIVVACVGAAVLVAAGEAPEFDPSSSQDNALERLLDQRAKLGSRRREVREVAWESFRSHPITGVGFADATRPHNFLLQMSSTAGLLGLAGGLMIVGLALRGYLVSLRRRLSDPVSWPMAAGLSSAVVGYLAANSFQNVTWDRTAWVAIALMAWLTATVGSRRRQPADKLGAADKLGVQSSDPAPAPMNSHGRLNLPARPS